MTENTITTAQDLQLATKLSKSQPPYWHKFHISLPVGLAEALMKFATTDTHRPQLSGLSYTKQCCLFTSDGHRALFVGDSRSNDSEFRQSAPLGNPKCWPAAYVKGQIAFAKASRGRVALAYSATYEHVVPAAINQAIPIQAMVCTEAVGFNAAYFADLGHMAKAIKSMGDSKGQVNMTGLTSTHDPVRFDSCDIQNGIQITGIVMPMRARK